MNVAEKAIIEQAIKYPNDYRNIEALANLAKMAINQRNKLLEEKATADRIRMMGISI